MRRPSRNEILIIFAAALAVVSAALAVLFWSRRGVCSDFVICLTISILTVLGILMLVHRMSAVAGARALSDRPVLLVMKTGPRKERKTEKRIEGKMPEELDH